MSALRTLVRWFPDLPRPMYTVFAGTSTVSDGLRALVASIAGGGSATDVSRLSAMLGEATGCQPASLFGAGRMGLYAILEALGLEPGDEIILPAFTCAVVPNAMMYRGVRPVYVDIDPRTFNIDVRAIEAAITPRTRAIYAQHTFGVSCDVGAIRAIADRRGLLVIEDLAHALGATVAGKPVGSFGDASFGSTDRTKVVNTHIGGWASSPKPEVAAKLAASASAVPPLSAGQQRRAALALGLECIGRDPALLWIGRPVLGVTRRLGVEFVWRDEQSDSRPAEPPYPCRFPASLAPVGIEQLTRLEANLAHRRRIARFLESRLGWYGPHLARTFDEQAWLRYSFLVRDRAEFVARFGRRIDLGIWFTEPIFGRPDSADRVGYRAGSCPNAERAAVHVVNLPTHRRLPLSFLEKLFDQHGAWLAGQILRPET